jgi:hypothetical protein
MKKQNIKVTPFKYAQHRGFAPHGYSCGGCGATHVKLWREYNTCLDFQTLYCMKCVCEVNKKPVPKTLSDNCGEFGPSDQLEHPKAGSLVPAIPTEDGSNYWGYTSVPIMGVVWWQRLNGPKQSAVEILDSYHKLIYAKEMFEDGVNKAHNKETKEYYQNLLDDTILAIDAVWLDVTGQM